MIHVSSITLIRTFDCSSSRRRDWGGPFLPGFLRHGDTLRLPRTEQEGWGEVDGGASLRADEKHALLARESWKRRAYNNPCILFACDGRGQVQLAAPVGHPCRPRNYVSPIAPKLLFVVSSRFFLVCPSPPLPFHPPLSHIYAFLVCASLLLAFSLMFQCAFLSSSSLPILNVCHRPGTSSA